MSSALPKWLELSPKLYNVVLFHFQEEEDGEEGEEEEDDPDFDPSKVPKNQQECKQQ